MHRLRAFPPKVYSANLLHICPTPSLIPLASPAKHCQEKGPPSPLRRPAMVHWAGTWHPHRTMSCQRAAVPRPIASCGKARHPFQRRNKVPLAAWRLAPSPSCVVGRWWPCGPTASTTRPQAPAPHAPLSCCHPLSD